MSEFEFKALLQWRLLWEKKMTDHVLQRHSVYSSSNISDTISKSSLCFLLLDSMLILISNLQEFKQLYIAILIQIIPSFLHHKSSLSRGLRDPTITTMKTQIQMFRVMALQQLIGEFSLYNWPIHIEIIWHLS